MKTHKINFWNTALWASMAVLVILAFWIAENSEMNAFALTITILGVTLFKFLCIGFQFMELKHAHPVWRFSFSAFILLFVSIIILLFK